MIAIKMMLSKDGEETIPVITLLVLMVKKKVDKFGSLPLQPQVPRDAVVTL